MRANPHPLPSAPFLPMSSPVLRRLLLRRGGGGVCDRSDHGQQSCQPRASSICTLKLWVDTILWSLWRTDLVLDKTDGPMLFVMDGQGRTPASPAMLQTA